MKPLPSDHPAMIEGHFWTMLPKRERLPGEIEALRELVAAVEAEAAEEKAALAAWLNG